MVVDGSLRCVLYWYIGICNLLSPQVGEFIDVGHLVLSGVRTDLSLDPGKAGREWLRLSKDEVSIACIELNGICEVVAQTGFIQNI